MCINLNLNLHRYVYMCMSVCMLININSISGSVRTAAFAPPAQVPRQQQYYCPFRVNHIYLYVRACICIHVCVYIYRVKG